ncbi:COP9 signalosome complex subunit 5 [Cystobasidium minutum MCA 4210]|uniref:COP9 signalosome complex subunit 5 n=1 Tax=Cystobasidium minutum MCA 4210 TaxID=1397322 RepID=UPI0034CF273C|eukprot:jgi/Rhomi1/184128/fgenesh1_pm.5_\
MGSKIAQSTWELNNSISTIDEVYNYDNEGQRAILRERPWKKDPHHFKHVRISAVALVKMVTHARSGGAYEIMGLMQGKIEGDTFIVMDAFALPVTGTETRVNAGSEGEEYMVQYQTMCQEVSRKENVVGWYHSHPGYGCWLSGIDVSTQMLNQGFNDPFLAVVIDPNRTISAGKVDIGAFRTYPENYTPPNAQASEYQSIPLNKIEDFGVHASRYYPLDVSFFKSSLDTQLLELLWNKYWVMTLSQSPLISNRAYTISQISDLTEKLNRAEGSVSQRAPMTTLAPEIAASKTSNPAQNLTNSSSKGKENAESSAGVAAAVDTESALAKVVKDSSKITAECQHGLM